MGIRSVLALAILQYLVACTDSDFKGSVSESTAAVSQDAVPATTSETITSSSMFPDEPDEPVDSLLSADSVVLDRIAVAIAATLTLEVKTSAPDVRAGKNAIQAEAVLSSPSSSKILWTLEGASGVDLGTIDSSGKYLSPESASAELVVTIVATLESDPSVVGKKSITVIPAEQLFVGCVKSNVSFPISADVFKLPSSTLVLPDFSTMVRDDFVCLDKFDIPLQSWEVGFPGSPSLQEWFALHSKTKLVVTVPGIYQFRLTSDDGAKLYIGGALIIDNDGVHSVSSKEGSLSLAAGSQDLVLDYFQGPRTEVALQLFWKVPGTTEFVIVPSSAFAAE